MRPLGILGSILVASLAVVACGDDDGGTTLSPPDTTVGSAAEAGGGGQTVTVEIGEFVFEPTPVEIQVGDSIAWENVHDQPHTASGNGDQRWDTANIQPGGLSEPVRFDEAGTYTYLCGLHPFMEGVVEVSA